MITLPGIIIQAKLYESSATLVYRGIGEQDRRAVVAKVLKQDYPSSQELTRYRQEYEITRSLNLEGVVKAYSQQDYQRTLVILLEDLRRAFRTLATAAIGSNWTSTPCLVRIF